MGYLNSCPAARNSKYSSHEKNALARPWVDAIWELGVIRNGEPLEVKWSESNAPRTCVSGLSVANTLAVLILAFFMARQQSRPFEGTLDSGEGGGGGTAGVDTPHADSPPQPNNFLPCSKLSPLSLEGRQTFGQ